MKHIFKTYFALIVAGICFLPLNTTAATYNHDSDDSLKIEKLFLPINDVVDRKLSSSSSRTTDGSVLEKYPTLDILNSITGVVPGLFQTENTGATGTRFGAENCGINVRGFNAVKFIVDDVFITEISELMLNPEDIESITLVTDIMDKARFGPEIGRGAIYIKTLRGSKERNIIRAGFERGVDIVDRLPEWVNGTDYANLNNFARLSSGYDILFSQDDINAISREDEFDPVYPNVNWREKIFKGTRSITKAYVLSSGGFKNMTYSANLGYANHGDLYATGEASNYNRFNANMHLGVTVTPQLTFDFSFLGSCSIRRSPFFTYQTDGTYEYPSYLEYVNTIPATTFPLWLGTNEETGRKEYSVTNTYGKNPYAALNECGFYNETGRTAITAATLTYDMSDFVKGLKSETHIGYNLYYLTRLGQSADYLAYIVKEDGTREVTSHKGQAESDKSLYDTSYLQSLQFNETLRWGLHNGNNDLDFSATYYRSKLAYSISSSYHNQQNYIFNASYGFKKKYVVEAVLNYAGSSALLKGHRYKAFPSFGIGWVASDEPFLRESRSIDYLKFRAQCGMLGNESYGTQYYWESYYKKGSSTTFGPYNTNQWFGSSITSSNSTSIERYSNPYLGWETHKEIEAGFDALLFRHISLGFTWFNVIRDGVVADISSVSPMIFGPGSIFDNYNKFKYNGAELTVSYSNRHGDLSYTLGGFATYMNSEVLKYNETVNYDYLSKVGNSANAIFGYDYIGKFTAEEDIASSPKQVFDSSVQVGDLKYSDLNNDGIIDSNDRKVIGDSAPKLRYAVNANIKYRNLELSVVGTGCAFYDIVLNNDYFWNGWGDGNYSAFVKENVGGSYPRLSYTKSQNNFRDSQFWMRDGSFFKIQNAEIAYDWQFKHDGKIDVDGIRLFVRGANLLTISGIKDVDPESISAGVSDYPLFKTFTGGFRITF